MPPYTALPVIVTIFALYVSKTYTTPIHNHLEANSPLCPDAWFQFGKFCVAHAPQGSELSVALYCDALGGIGVNGLCVIKVRSDLLALKTSELEVPSGYSSLLTNPSEDDMEREDGSEVERRSDAVRDEEGLCPRGWSHFQSICVRRSDYKGDNCYRMNGIHFHGMCLKHTEQRETNLLANDEGLMNRDRRLCCCAHPGSNENGYAC